MKKTTNKTFAVFCLLMAMSAPHLTFGWGSKGHTAINRVAAEKIPKSMPGFLRSRAAIEQIAYWGPEPDRWRGTMEYALNNAQAPDHFIDLERIEGLGELPRGRYEFYQLLYQKGATATDHPADYYLPENVGLQPYITIEVFERLRVAFRNYRQAKAEHMPTGPSERNIIFYAGWLGHYVADGAQPLHTTEMYDGWIGANPKGYTTTKGIHSEFETQFVDRSAVASEFSGTVHAPEQLSDPFADYQKYLWTSHGYVERVYELEKAKAFEGTGTPAAVRFTEERMAAGSQELVDLWYTAWMQSADIENASKY